MKSLLSILFTAVITCATFASCGTTCDSNCVADSIDTVYDTTMVEDTLVDSVDTVAFDSVK